ncbi:MAG: ribosome maturation factor RimM [Thermomicrobiaceae bacterium]
MTEQPHDPNTAGDTGDENESPMERLTIGRVVSPHGIRGEIRMYIYTHFPDRIPELPHVFIGDESTPRKVNRARLKGNLAIMRIEGINTREMAEELRDQIVQIDIENAAPLEEDEHYYFEIIGLTAVDESGNVLGEVTDIIETGANDVYVIKDDEGKELLIPALKDVVPEVNIEAGRMVVRPLSYSDDA